MRIFLVLLASLFPLPFFAQSVQELERQLQEASSPREKMALNYQLASALLKSDAKKSIEFAKAAHNKALELNNDGMAAEAAHLASRGYNRLSDERNQDVWLGSAVKFAKAASDANLIIKAVDERSRLAVRRGNERQALQITQDAFDYFSNKGGKSLGEMQAQHEKQRQDLEREKNGLNREIATLKGEREVLKRSESALTEQHKELKQEKETAVQERQQAQEQKVLVEQEVSKKEEEIKAVSREKLEAQFIAKVRKSRIDSLESRKAIDSLTIEKQKVVVENATLESERGRYATWILGIAALSGLLLAGLLYLRFRANQKTSATLSKQNKIIEQERQRSDELLYNILPAAVAKELKEKGAATAQKFPEATVLLTDFKNFTQIAEQLSPEKLVEELNACFRAFDHIVSQHPEIEKIKTIGDAYLCASGLVKNKTVPKGIVKAALEMQEFLEDYKREKVRTGEPWFDARIGIHTGPVVAGVVGFKKFAYDIWGDTVNIASRMEEACEPGKVNISETTYGLVKYSFDCQPRGRFEVKNKGVMEMYYVRRAM